MSEPVAKERPSIDLDDFERRLRHQDHQEDPLAELARLVGETHDPYGDVFAQEAVPNPAHAYQPSYQTQGFDAPVGMSPRLSGDFAAIEAGLRGALPAHPEHDPHADAAAQSLYAPQDQYAPQPQYAPDDHYAHDEQTYLRDHEDQQWAELPQQPAPRSRRPIYAMVATIAVGVIGVGVAFAYKGAGSSPSEIRTISAASGPTKIHPPVEAASDQGSQDPAVLGKNGQPAPTRLVSGAEQPVDISQAVQENASRNPDVGAGQGDAANVPVPPSPGLTGAAPSVDQAPAFGMSDMPPPKKVKVVSVRPDGTILTNDAPPAAVETPSPTPPQAAADPSDIKAPVAKPSTPGTKSTSRVAAKPTQAGAPDDGGATPAPKPARKAKPKRVASAAPTDTNPSLEPTGTPAAPPASDTEPTATTKPGGGFAVQLAAPGSESEARSASSRLAKKFASALDGRRLGFHKAQSNGKSVFRVRVGSLTREDANSLCEKLKADGGTCFVAKNN